MELLKTIRDADVGIETPIPSSRKERRASRGVVFDQSGNVALLHVAKKHYHKLPGGGLENEENPEDAFRRETLEEIGCSIQKIREIGIIEEFRDRFALRQLSYCFVADVAGEKGESHLEQGEIEDGFESIWISLSEAIAILENETAVEDYEGKFIQIRDLTILKEAQRLLT